MTQYNEIRFSADVFEHIVIGGIGRIYQNSAILAVPFGDALVNGGRFVEERSSELLLLAP